jgi:hypothetical protein
VFNKASEVYIDREEYAPRKLKKALYTTAYVSTIDTLQGQWGM